MAKSYPTTYVPTSGATATRNAETLTIPAAGILGLSAGTIIAKPYLDGQLLTNPSTQFKGVFRHTTGTGYNDGLLMGVNTTNLYWETTNNTGAPSAKNVTANKSGLSEWSTGWRHIGMRYHPGELSGWWQGVKVGSVVNPNLPTAYGTIQIANDTANSATNRQLNQPIAYVVIYDRALSDAEMAAATTGNLPAGYTALVDFRKGTSKVRLGTPYRVGEWLRMGLDAPEE